MAQLLPSDESFESPDWLITSAAGASLVPKFFWWYLGFDPSDLVDESVHTTYPLRDGGPLETVTTTDLYIAYPDFDVGLPAIMTDKTGGDINAQRAVIARSLVPVQDNTSYKVLFGIQEAGGGTAGSSQGGYNGSGPGPLGWVEYPTPSGITGDDHTTAGSGAGGNFTPGGTMDNSNSPAKRWKFWLGNSLFFRCGEGYPKLSAGSTTSGTQRYGNWAAVDCYSFLAYPVTNGSVVDLYLELWQTKFTPTGVTWEGTPRLVIQQVVNDGVQYIDFRQPYHFRVTVDTNGSDVDMTAFLGPYINPMPGSSEVQCFKDGVFVNDTYTLGTDVTQTSSTGLVKDEHADNITAHANKTIGWSLGTERKTMPRDAINLGGEEIEVGVQEGVYSVEVTDASAGTVLYKDEFQRVGNDLWYNPGGAPVVGLFGTAGFKGQGMFTYDYYCPDMSVAGGGYPIEPLLGWSASESSFAAVDYALMWYDRALSSAQRIVNVMRSFIYERPSTQLYNHHRAITFQIGDATGTTPDSGATSLSFEFGIILRGYATGRTTSATVCYIAWTIDLSNNLTYWSLRIAERNCNFTHTDPASDPAKERIIASKTYTSGFPTFNNSAFHTLDFRAEVYSGATDPASAAIYHVTYDGVAVNLDDTAPPYQSSAATGFPVTHPNPVYYSGRSEGVWFLADEFRFKATGAYIWNPSIIKTWAEGALTTDPGTIDPDLQASIVVSGEGTAVGSLNATSGALGISGGGVWNVETEVDVEFFYRSRRVDFASGHTYTGPATSKPRRRWRVAVHAADLTVYQSLQTFYNAHDGPEIPFSFIVPIPDDGTATGSTAEATETVVGWFNEDALLVSEVGPQVYSISFSVVELLVT